jgi:hypothetical protein
MVNMHAIGREIKDKVERNREGRNTRMRESTGNQRVNRK